MAVVKILQSSKGYDAVGYNEKRCKKGEAQLLYTSSFEGKSKFLSYTDYLRLYNSRNTRIKNPLLHCTISAKGDSLTDEELKDIGIKWLDKMGYSKNPFLIFIHDNTENRHIHIVASRIKPDGTKVNDSFEKERAIKCLHEIEGVDLKSDCRKIINGCLHYSFSTKFQLMELCTRAGFKCKITNDGLQLKKGESIIKLTNQLIDFCSNRYHRDITDREKKRMQGLIYKYASQLNKENFVPFMKTNFGLEFIFYGKDGTFNGFTIIDYKNKSVYKGSEVFGMKKLSELLELPQKPDFEFDLAAQALFKSSPFISYSEFCSYMAMAHNYHIEGRNIVDKLSGETYFLNDKLYNRFIYNDRLKHFADVYKPFDMESAKVVASVARVSARDLLTYTRSYYTPFTLDADYYNTVLRNALSSKSNIRDFLNDNELSLVFRENKYYLLDAQLNAVIDGSLLDVGYDELRKQVNDNRLKDDFTYLEDDSEFSMDSPAQAVNIDMMTGLFFIQSGGGVNNKPRKRRPKR